MSRALTVYGSLTTPDPIALHQLLDRLASNGVTNLALEASSHGLDQKRLDGVRLASAAFTNLTRDHMDYHATVEDYLAAKLRLFRDPRAASRQTSTTWKPALASPRAIHWPIPPLGAGHDGASFAGRKTLGGPSRPPQTPRHL